MNDESRTKPDARKDGTESRTGQRTMRSRGMDAAIAYLERQGFMVAASPWSTPIPGLFLCSAATPPGGGVHGMCGAHAAEVALRWVERRGHRA